MPSFGFPIHYLLDCRQCMFCADTTSLAHLGEQMHLHALVCDSEASVKIEFETPSPNLAPESLCSRGPGSNPDENMTRS